MPTVIVRSRLARVGTVLVAVAVVLMAGAVWLSDGYGNGLRALSLGLLFLTGVWLLWWRPALVLTTDALTVHNAWRTHLIDWAAVARTGTRWGLEIVTTDDAVIRASAAPRAGGIMAGVRQHIETTRGHTGQDGSHRVSREELVTPGEGTYRLSADATQSGDLVELYAAEVENLRRLVRRQERREARIAGRHDARPGRRGTAGSRGGAASADGGVGADTDGAGVVSRLNLDSVVVTALAVLTFVLTRLL